VNVVKLSSIVLALYLSLNNIEFCNLFFGNPKDFYFFLGRLLEESLLQSFIPASDNKPVACGDAMYFPS
jgi:hypothetical protein